MRFVITTWAGLVLSGLVLSDARCAGEEFPRVTTGSRTWSMADGSMRKLRFVGFGTRPEIATFQWGAAPGGLPLAKLSEESRAFLDGIRDGRIELLKTPGLSAEADFPAGPLVEPQYRGYRVGEVREWSHRNGRKVRGSLINLNDEAVSLLIGEKVWNLPVGELSEDDHRYLDEVKAGRAAIAPLSVSLAHPVWDGGPGRHVSVNGHRVAGEPASDRRFEEAMAKAIETVSLKLDGKFWEFHELREQSTRSQVVPGWSFLAPPDPAEMEREIVSYQATFLLTAEGRGKAAVVWPLSVTPKSWGGPPALVIDLAPDAELATVQAPVR